MTQIKIASAQFHVSKDVRSNLENVMDQMKQAAEEGAAIIHFSECCLSGYPDIDIKTCENNPEINKSLHIIRQHAQELSLWVIVGTHYFENENAKPRNSLFVCNDQGELVLRYDKRVLAGDPGVSDRAHYMAADKPATFMINGVNCGLIICHEWRYPELFREYKQLGVELIFHSFYDGNLNKETYEAEGIELGELIMGSERGNAANNYLWFSITNTSKNEQVFPAAVINPDGSIANQATRNKPEIIITDIDTTKNFIDPSRYGRDRITELYPDGILRSEKE